FTPLLERSAGFSADATTLILLAYGAFSFVGNLIVGKFADTHAVGVLRFGHALLFVSLALIALFADVSPLVLAMVLVVGFAGVTMNPALVTRVAGTVHLGEKVTTTLELTPQPDFKFDRDQIEKVVVNLLLNAGEAMEHGGQLKIATSRTEGWAVITTTDTGCGMSADFLNRSLFRPFQTTKKTGLGIGMFQCKAIVEAHGGKISVVSEPGQGTVFQVFLPLTP
ncbi:MAG: ATP-binding protein, partial [Verrucomicrobia bacterium]|nr:ATP-binding protein [Verrucomicrobiota bacterium]